MRYNTPPRIADIEDELGEEYVENELLEEDDDLEMEEISLEELMLRAGTAADSDSDDENESKSPVQDDSILTFRHHLAPVFSCAMLPKNDLCATGGEDEKVFVWNRNTGEVLYEINDHNDTVTEVHFNHDGTYLASGDRAGKLLLHNIQESTGGDDKRESNLTFRKNWEYYMGDMSWMCWHKTANILVAGSEDGEIYIFHLPAGKCKILPGHGVRCSAGEISGDGKKLFASYSDGTFKLWDMKTASVVMEVDEQHPMVYPTESITTVASDQESPLYVSGDEKGKKTLIVKVI